MRILVTGGAGYIGSHTARLLLERGHEVWAFDNLSRGHHQAAPLDRLLIGDLQDQEAIEAALVQHDIEAVVHFAAFTYVGESVKDPAAYYRNNFIGTLNLLDALSRRGVRRIVFSSTAAAYGIPATVPISEEEPTRPINPYGRAKLAVEWALADYAAAYGLGYTALRYFNAAGASRSGELGEDHDPETHLIPLVLQAALERRPAIEVFGTDYPTPDGTCVRDYVHVEDLAEAHLLALQRIEPGQGKVYNLGTGRGYSVLEVIRTCEMVTARSIPVRFGPRREGDPPVLVASPEKAFAELGWRPRFRELLPIVETAWRWHSTHPDGYDRNPAEEAALVRS
jgi:UDP-glucose 4-epimerase